MPSESEERPLDRSPSPATRSFELHPRLAADTFLIDDWPLCRLLLMNDAQYPWCILVPRRNNIREIYDLCGEDQRRLLQESSALGQAMMAAFTGHKLNVAALGNMVAQLHIHHIVRFQTDAAWPAPVWGKHPPQPYSTVEHTTRIAQLRTHLTVPT